MGERPKHYDNWPLHSSSSPKDKIWNNGLKQKIEDYLAGRGYKTDRIEFESTWVGTLNVELGLNRDKAESWGFTPDELDTIDKVRYNAQAELDKRTSFSKKGTLSGPNPFATPEIEVRRMCQERIGNLDNIIHMWDILAIIGGPVGARTEPPAKEQPKPRFDLFHGLRGSASSTTISSMQAQRARAALDEAFADTIRKDSSPGEKPEPAPKETKNTAYVRPGQGKGPAMGKGLVTEPPHDIVFSREFISDFGKSWAEMAGKMGLREEVLKSWMSYGFETFVLQSRMRKAQEAGNAAEFRQEVQKEVRMLDYLKDHLCGGSLKDAKVMRQAGEDAWGAIFTKILSNLWTEWRGKQTDIDVLPKMSREARNQLSGSFYHEAREQTNQIARALQTPPGGANLPGIEKAPPSSTKDAPPTEANVLGQKGPEVKTPPGGANLPLELRNKPPRSTEKPPPKETPKPPGIDIDMERPPEFPITFPQRAPGSETFPFKEPQSTGSPSETPPAGDSGKTDTPSQSEAPGSETFPFKEPQCTAPPSDTPLFTLPALPNESKCWSLASETLSPPGESGKTEENAAYSEAGKKNEGEGEAEERLTNEETGGARALEGESSGGGAGGGSGEAAAAEAEAKAEAERRSSDEIGRGRPRGDSERGGGSGEGGGGEGGGGESGGGGAGGGAY